MTAQDTFRATIEQLIDSFVPDGWAGLGACDEDEHADVIQRWRELLVQNRLLSPTWPKEYGGADLPVEQLAVLFETVVRRGLFLWGDTDAVGISLIGASLLQWGTPEQKKRFLPRILTGEDVWCQGFSEPGSGSDLASLSTRAVLDGDRWVINGQKIWSSGAARANWIFMLARTEPDAPSHRGISMMLVPMNQPGIEVRPITNIRGDAEFCEVFFTDAVTESDLVLGGRGAGWNVTMSLLGNERGETVLYVPAEFEEELGRLVDFAYVNGAIERHEIRSRLAKCRLDVEIMKAISARELASMARGGTPGPEAGGFKALYTEYHQRATELALDILGFDAVAMRGHPSANWLRTDDPGSPPSARSWLEVYLNARAGSIYAGTNQIQRNVVGEHVLGLPREPRVK